MAGRSFPDHPDGAHPDGAISLFPELAAVPDEARLVAGFIAHPVLSETDRGIVLTHARDIARVARKTSRLFSAEKIMTIYRLSTAEGRMIMELAEALLRIPDSTTRDFLIFDKLAPGHWLQGDAKGFFRGMEVALGLAGSIIRGGRQTGLAALVSRLGVPTVRQAIGTAMRQMGGQFVFAETIEAAERAAAASKAVYSFDMLGEAARSEEDCQRYDAAYAHAIDVVGAAAGHDDVNRNSGVSIKLSALSCRFAARYWSVSHEELVGRVTSLALSACRHNIPLTIDAEEFGRLKPSLSVFERLLACPELQGWAGLGIVVQAYSRHAGAVIDWLEDQVRKHSTKISVRLVKGAYWDAEIKLAQEKGLPDFPVYTSKRQTDLAYLAHAKRLMDASAYFHPQFASHNAYTLSAIVHLAGLIKPASYELQKLHGMGNAVHDEIASIAAAPLRVYAPVGQHHDLLAYLVRRILENGASSSFLNQLTDQKIDIETVISDPFMADQTLAMAPVCGTDLFAPVRKNSRGFDIEDDGFVQQFETLVRQADLPTAPTEADQDDIDTAFISAGKTTWKDRAPADRADILNAIADGYEAASDEIFRLLVHEAGKTIDDAVAELREAVDFCRFYASRASHLPPTARARGTVVAISPWNFPLAIFTGQITAALAAGNAVIAKPAEATPRIAALAISLMHEAGVPRDALQLLCGDGAVIGHHLITAGQADMVVFTGSIQTAKLIERTIAKSAKPHAPLIAETGGINAMIVDSSALLERVVDDVLTSAFRSAGQRCSALRMLYIQEDIAPVLIDMICAAAAALTSGGPGRSDTDIGPVIDWDAKSRIDQHVASAARDARLVWQGQVPQTGCFTPPSIIRVDGIADLGSEIFGPVLHIATYRAGGEAMVVEAINRAGYGLTFGMHSRIDANIEAVTNSIDVGNIYINRNQIGAVVGSQPFGGHGLSGTGPKAGGDAYIKAFMTSHDDDHLTATGLLPGPSGEMNSYSVSPRGRVLVIHPDPVIRQTLALRAKGFGNDVAEHAAIPDMVDGVAAVMTKADGMIDIGQLRDKLHLACQGIIPLVVDEGGDVWLCRERHVCRDMTASGGNIDLLMRT